MTGMAMMQILIRMSIQGSIIVGIVWILRMVFRGLRISYRYCVLLWGIVFFYLIFPWKIENEHGFWRAQPESMVVAVSADGPTVVTGLGTGIVLGPSAVPEQNVTPGQSTLPEQMNGTDVLAALTALQNYIKNKRKLAGKDYEKIQSGCGHDCLHCGESGCSERFYDNTNTTEEAVKDAVKAAAKPQTAEDDLETIDLDKEDK